MKITVVIPVQYKNFFSILGLSGDPGSSPSILTVFVLFTSIGNITKKYNPPYYYVDYC
jgi:hypothetical protein